MSLSIFRPLNTLERYDALKHLPTQAETCETLTTLSQLDVNLLDDIEIEAFSNFWCKIMILIKFRIAVNKIELTDQVIVSIINSAETAILLHLRLQAAKKPSMEPILSFLGLSDDIFNEEEPPDKYPIRSIKSTDSHFMLISFFKELCPNESKLKVNEVFSLAIEIAASAHKIQNADPAYEYTFDSFNVFKNLSDESLKSENLSQIADQLQGYPTFPYLIILFLYEYLFDSTVPRQFTIPNFYSRLLSFFESSEKANSFSTFLVLTSSDPIDYSNNILSLPLFGLIFRKALKIDESVLFKINEDTKFNQLLQYALYVNIDHPILDKFFSQEFPEKGSSFLKASRDKLGLSESSEELIKKACDGNADAAKKLYRLKTPSSKLTDEKSALQNILRLLQSDDIEIKDPSDIDDFTHIKLIRLFQLGRNPSLEFIIEMIKNLHEKIMESTPKETFDIIMCNCPYNSKDETYSIPLPLTIEDFIIDLPFKPYIAFSQLIYLTVIAYDLPINKNEELMNLYVDLSLHFYLNYINDNNLVNFLLEEMPPEFETKRNKARIQHAIKAVKITSLEKRIETLKALKPLLDDTEMSLEITQFLVNNGDNKSLASLFKMSPSSASQIAQKLDKEKLFKLFEVLFEQDMYQISIEYANLLLKDDNNNEIKKKLIQIFCKNALEHPKTVAQVFLAPSLNMSIEDTGELLSNLPEFSNEVSIGFTQLLNKLLNLLPAHSIMLKKPPPEIPQISTAWEDDLLDKPKQDKKETDKEKDENSNTAPPIPRPNNNTKFVDIWKYPEHPEKCLKDSAESHYSFYCYTCGITGNDYICQNCAELCHFGHDIGLVSMTDHHTCKCGSHCIACRQNLPQFPQATEKETEKVEEHTSPSSCVSDSVLLKLFINLVSSNIAQSKASNEQGIEGLFGNSKQSLAEISLDGFDGSSIISETPFKLKLISESPKLLNISDLVHILSSREQITHLIRLLSVMPLHIMEFAGPMSNILVVCNGRKLISYSITQPTTNANNTENSNNNDAQNNNDNVQNNNNESANVDAHTNSIINGSSLKQLHQFQIDHTGLQLSVCPLDPSIIAVVSIHHVTIINVDENGSFKQTTEIELMLEDIGSHIFVNSVYWLPNQLMHLAVVCNVFVKIYDVPQDCFSPVAYYVPPQDCFFTSVAFTTVDEEKSIVLFGINTGRIAIREISGEINDTSPNGITVSKFIDFKKRIPQNPIISISEENDLVFISSQQSSNMFVIRLSKLIDVMIQKQQPTENNNNSKVIDTYEIKLGDDKNGALSLIGSVGTINFFEHPASGSIASINFNTENSTFDVSYMNKSIPNCSLPLFENQMSTLSTLFINNKLYAISPTNGKLMYLTLADSTESDDDDDDNNDNSNTNNNNDNNNEFNENFVFSDDDDDNDNYDDNDNPYNDVNDDDDSNHNRPAVNENIKVPARFWVLSKISANDISIVESKNYNDIHKLLNGNRYVFDNTLKHKALLIQSTNPNQLIVGFRVFLGSSSSYHRPPWVKVNGRKQTVNCMRLFMLPLKPSEVKPKAVSKIELGSNNGYDINCDRVDVFVIDKSMFPKEYFYLTVKSYDWFNLGTSLFDFYDSKDSVKNKGNKFNDRILNLMNLCTLSIVGNSQEENGNNNSNENDIINEEQFRKVIRLMYSNSKASEMCRRLIVKCVRNRKDAEKIWADEIIQTVRQKIVADGVWELIWRDISLFPQELMEKTANEIWESDYVVDGPCSVISAFMTKS